MDPIEQLGALLKSAPGGQRAEHKYFKREATGNADHPWRYYYTEEQYRREKGGGGGHVADRANAEIARLSATLEEFEQAIGAGKIHGDVGEHIRVAQAEVQGHEQALPALMSDLKAMAGKGKVKARVKKLESVLGKIVRKPKYRDAAALQDLTGARIVHENVEQVMATVRAIKAKYEVVTEDNYIDAPQGDYRSYHLIVEHEGRQKEIQVRTKNQDVFADFAHNIYKPLTPAQEQAIRTSRAEVEQYSKQAAAHYWALDSGAEDVPPPPPCIPVVKQAFGCLSFGAEA